MDLFCQTFNKRETPPKVRIIVLHSIIITYLILEIEVFVHHTAIQNSGGFKSLAEVSLHENRSYT